MAEVVTLTGVTPLPRHDGIPWYWALLFESEVKEPADPDAWVLIDRFSLDPVDEDPRFPQARTFTTDNATIPTSGWYKVEFRDQDEVDHSPTLPIQNLPDVTEQYAPALSEVGALIRPRTVDNNSNELGTFTANTRPTQDQALRLIRFAASRIAAGMGPHIPDEALEDVKFTVAVRAAMLIELGYFGDQIEAGRSPYNELKTLYDELWADLETVRVRAGLDLELGTDDDLSAAGLPAFAFPAIQSFRAPGAESPWPSVRCYGAWVW